MTCYDSSMVRRYLPKSVEELVRWYERYVSPFSLLVGFSIDVVASQVLALEAYSIILMAYLILASFGILFLHALDTRRIHLGPLAGLVPFVPVLIQFAFGGLYSGFVLLYSKSASFAFSWVFVVLLAALLLGNERFRRLYTTFPVQVGILYFALFSFSIFYVPVALTTVSAWLFLVSGAVSVVIIAGYLLLARIIIPTRVKETIRPTIKIVAGVYVLIHVLYIVNAIPPLPLALRDAGLFHSVKRVGSDYEVRFEPRKWYEVYLRYQPVFTRKEGEPLYVYTAVYAPTGVSTGLKHEWQFYESSREEWVTRDTISFPISGGRAAGYRGYSVMRSAEDGEWRVNVLTEYGKLIGRVAFTVATTQSDIYTETAIR